MQIVSVCVIVSKLGWESTNPDLTYINMNNKLHSKIRKAKDRRRC